MGSEHYVSMLSFVDKDLLEPNCTVLLHHKVHAVIGVLSNDIDPLVSCMKVEKAPTESYADIGGLEQQIMEIKEAVELPLTHPEYYEEMGIKAPKGVILYGPPGTGKTLLAKAVANQTSATFLRIVGSELIQKYLGDGPKLVRELFRVAEVAGFRNMSLVGFVGVCLKFFQGDLRLFLGLSLRLFIRYILGFSVFSSHLLRILKNTTQKARLHPHKKLRPRNISNFRFAKQLFIIFTYF